MQEECVLYDRLCINCGECDKCDFDRTKNCDNCGQCINNAEAYRTLNVEEFTKTLDDRKKVRKEK